MLMREIEISLTDKKNKRNKTTYTENRRQESSILTNEIDSRWIKLCRFGDEGEPDVSRARSDPQFSKNLKLTSISKVR